MRRLVESIRRRFSQRRYVYVVYARDKTMAWEADLASRAFTNATDAIEIAWETWDYHYRGLYDRTVETVPTGTGGNFFRLANARVNDPELAAMVWVKKLVVEG